MAELEFKYEGILAEENLQLSDLPMAIRKSINVLKPNYAKYQKNPTDGNRNALIQMDVDVSNQILNWLEEEAEADEEEERLAAAAAAAKANAQAQAQAQAEEKARIKAEQEAAAKLEQERLATEEAEKAKADEEARLAAEAQAKSQADEEAAAKLKEEEDAKAEVERLAAEEAAKSKAYKFGTSEMANAIKEKIQANGSHILISELKTLIGKEPSYPYQEVYDIKLHKPYMKSYYVIV